MMTILKTTFILPLILTLIIETAVCLLWRYKSKEFLKFVLIMNVATNLSLNLILFIKRIFSMGRFEYALIIPLEIIIVIIEWKLLKAAFPDKERLLYLSIAMNAASFVFGMLIFDIINRFLEFYM